MPPGAPPPLAELATYAFQVYIRARFADAGSEFGRIGVAAGFPSAKENSRVHACPHLGESICARALHGGQGANLRHRALPLRLVAAPHLALVEPL
jgi:hypothetical protein